MNAIGLLDGGAQLSVVGARFKKTIQELKLRTSPGISSIATADQTKHKIESNIELPILFKGREKVITAAFVPSLDEYIILGMDFWDAFEVKPSVYTISESIEQPITSESHILSSIESDE